MDLMCPQWDLGSGITKLIVMCSLYIEQFSDDTSTHSQDAQEALAKIIKVALDVSQLSKFTGREKPTVIT